jgi:hypothetical protein
MSVPIAMVDASTSASTQEVPSGVNATVATSYRLMGRAVQPHHPVYNNFAALILHCISISVMVHVLLYAIVCSVVCLNIKH